MVIGFESPAGRAERTLERGSSMKNGARGKNEMNPLQVKGSSMGMAQA